ncbi:MULTISPECIES: aminoglycoside phosphotransferase family protein [Actinomadura]|uniref:Aminoglycoside phosphotransferase family protein n=1 Tax=Actinomadura yumaensis TaxID=111807 RepID=A0ABW2D1M2_9ACTN|nr:hydroxyurea phosphotransferase [Actinomadura sp. J1-007]
MPNAYRIEVPALLAEIQAKCNGEAGRAWVEALPRLARTALERWDLRPDGGLMHGWAGLVVPVRRADGTPAIVKLRLVDEETEGEPLALRAWGGRGAVLLLDEDPATGAILMERLGTRSLLSVPDPDEALGVLSDLLARLVALPAPPGLRRLADIARDMVAEAPAAAEELGRDRERAMLATAADVVRDLLDEPGDRLLHWDLHYENVLAGTREPWLAIDPKPLAGDPGFDLMPALHNRWEEIVASGDAARAVRRRFDLMTERLGLDRARAAGWTLGRVLQNTLWDIEDGEDRMSDVQLTIGEALLPRIRP